MLTLTSVTDSDGYWCNVRWALDGEADGTTAASHRKLADVLREPYRQALALACARYFPAAGQPEFAHVIDTKRSKTIKRRLISDSYEKVAYPPGKIMICGELFTFGAKRVADLARKVGLVTWRELVPRESIRLAEMLPRASWPQSTAANVAPISEGTPLVNRNLPDGVDAMAKVTSIFALANDWAATVGPQPNSAEYWFVWEGAKAALGPERLAYVTRESDGTVVLHSLDFAWSFRNPPASAYREL